MHETREVPKLAADIVHHYASHCFTCTAFWIHDAGLLDGQVFTHAMLGIVCGVAAVGCGLASARKDRQYRWEGWIMTGLGFALGVWCIVMLPSTNGQQERFNDRTRKYREKMNGHHATINAGVDHTNLFPK
jgi:hypothetical protein